MIDTHWLTHERFELTTPERNKRRLLLAGGAAVLMLILAGHGFVSDVFVKARDFAALREERELLSAEVERLRAKLAVESATRRELEQQSADLNAEVAELGGQVEFLKAQRAPAKGADL